MNRILSISLLFLVPFQLVWAQRTDVVFHSDFEKASFNKTELKPFELLLASDPTVDADKYIEFREDFLLGINHMIDLKKRSKNDLLFLEKIFYKTHRKQLGWYQNYVSLSHTFESKKYDCLTGTALFALILEEVGIEYQILEFDFHIFLIARPDGHNVLIEATDPLNGFISDQKEINHRIQAALTSVEVDEKYAQTFIKNEIDLLALAGLQYYNLAVDLFNRQEYKKASQFIKKADLLYTSERIRNTKDLISSSASL
ncbi:MAG: hypothetical protein JXR03_09330 [Cyclobacteriaceae bacterium]